MLIYLSGSNNHLTKLSSNAFSVLGALYLCASTLGHSILFSIIAINLVFNLINCPIHFQQLGLSFLFCFVLLLYFLALHNVVCTILDHSCSPNTAEFCPTPCRAAPPTVASVLLFMLDHDNRRARTRKKQLIPSQIRHILLLHQ